MPPNTISHISIKNDINKTKAVNVVKASCFDVFPLIIKLFHYAFYILTCHSRKRTVFTNNISNGSVLSVPVSHDIVKVSQYSCYKDPQGELGQFDLSKQEKLRCK